MIYKDYFEKHETENFGWCKPYADKTGENWMIVYDGEVSDIVTPNGTYHRYDGTLTEEVMREFAFSVNNGYYCYHGWTDEHIAQDVMTETGCKSCPLREHCVSLHAEIDSNGAEYLQEWE